MKTRRILAFLFIATFMLSFSAAAIAQGEFDDDRDTIYTFEFHIPVSDDRYKPMLFDSPEGKMVTLGWNWLPGEASSINTQLTISIYHINSIGAPVFSVDLRPGELATFPIYKAGTYRIEVQPASQLAVSTSGIIKVVVPYLSSF